MGHQDFQLINTYHHKYPTMLTKFLLFACLTGIVMSKTIDTICTRGDWCKTTMDEQEHPEKLKEVAMTVAGVILKQKMSDTNPLGRDCKLEFVFVENFKNQEVTTETHHIFDATFKWTQCGTLNDHRSTCITCELLNPLKWSTL